MITNNEFYGGLDKDTDFLKKKNNTFEEGHNIRLINVEGQGYVATNVEGAEQKFSLTQGFIPLGKCEYNGIAYIFSVNPTSGQGEIGSYPSPDCAGNFISVYAPLKNFSANVNPIVNPNPPLFPFRTSLLGFDCTHQIECFARIDYDNSVNIYWTDFFNPIRVINSGFDQDGFCNNRYYWDGSFPTGIEMINETCAVPIASLNGINPGGSLKAGNYIFYFRYTTVDFNPTSFVGESNACQISPDDVSAGIRIDGAAGDTVTNKAVVLNLSNLDVSFPYLEVGFSYFKEGTFQTGLVDFLFLIGGNTNLTITITGLETIIDLTLEELLTRKSSDDVVKSITQLENRFWGANIKGRQLFNQDLVDLAKCIRIGFDDSLQIEDKSFQTATVPQFGEYKDYRKTYEETGYFRTEAYAFGVVFVFKSGRESEVFPCTGFDAFLDPGSVTVNDQGIFRFPSTFQSNTITQNGLSQFFLNVMGVTFDTTGCVLSQYVQDNICGFYFVRADREANLLNQGIVLNTYNENTADNIAPPPCVHTGQIGPLYHMDAKNHRIPMWPSPINAYGIYPVVTNDQTLGGIGRRNEVQPARHTIADKYGFFSSDHFLTKDFTDGNYFVQRIYKMDYDGVVPGLSPIILPSILADPRNSFGFDNNTVGTSVANVKAYSVQPWQTADNNGFVSQANEGSETDTDSLIYFKENCVVGSFEYKNRQFATSRYIGIDTAGSANGIDLNTEGDNLFALYPRLWIANIYRIDPINNFTNATLLSFYDVKNTIYHKISDFIPISDFATITPAKIFYRGDCFLQRTYHKNTYNPDYYNTTDMDDNGRFYKFGIVHGLITENALNTAMRHAVPPNNYYPEEGDTYVYDNVKYESEGYNEGYQHVLGLISFNGFDVNIPASSRVRRKPTRIIFSDFHQMNSLSDGYRKIPVGQFKDFDYRLGEINKIIDFHSQLVSVQDYGINYHFINERATLGGNSPSAELVIGVGDVLSQKTRNISDQYGSQHQWSIVKSGSAVYGVDWNKRKVWQLIQGVDPISDTKRISSLLFDIIEQDSSISDITEKLADNPVCNEGITSAYDRKFHDILICFTFNQNQVKPLKNFTLKFNEAVNAFTGTYDVNTPMFVTINEDFYTFNPNIFPSQVQFPTNLGDAWLEGLDKDSLGNDIKTTVFGVLKRARLGFIVNPSSDFAKVFDQHNFISGPEDLELVEYLTMFQSAIQNPFLQPLLNKQIRPLYLENAWRVPIMRTQLIINPTNNIYSPLSRFRGMWLKTTLQYFTNKPIFVKSVLTNYRPSKQ